MNISHSIFCLVILMVFSCEPALEDTFERVVIPQGAHSSSPKVQLLQSNTFKFRAIFDETAIYTSSSEENQHDANKLLGFSDCNSHHHQNSARFGWRWLDGKLEVLAYTYADGERSVEYLTDININESHDYQIKLKEDAYVFSVD